MCAYIRITLVTSVPIRSLDFVPRTVPFSWPCPNVNLPQHQDDIQKPTRDQSVNGSSLPQVWENHREHRDARRRGHLGTQTGGAALFRVGLTFASGGEHSGDPLSVELPGMRTPGYWWRTCGIRPQFQSLFAVGDSVPGPSRTEEEFPSGFAIPTIHVGDARTLYLSRPDFAVVYKLRSFIATPSSR